MFQVELTRSVSGSRRKSRGGSSRSVERSVGAGRENGFRAIRVGKDVVVESDRVRFRRGV